MNKFGSLYVEGDSFFHKMNPSVKLIMFILWFVSVFMFLDLRISLGLLVVGFILLKFADIPYNVSRNMFFAITTFNIINAIFILLITPDYGVTLTNNSQVITNIAGFKIYYATIMYIVVISLKYLSLLPLTIIFIFTTHPSKFAASLNKIGIPYKIAYITSIIFRYFPDIHHEFKIISNAQSARGLSYARDEKSLVKRIKNLFSITIPLINQAMMRIDKVSNAMDLRGFGRKNKRTWYNSSEINKVDILTLTIAILIFTLLVAFRINHHSSFVMTLL